MDIVNEVMVAVPTVNRPLPEKLEKFLGSTKFRVETTKNLEQELARTTLVSRLLESKCSHLFFIDSDMSPNVDLDEVIEKFYRLNLMVVSALTSSKGWHHQLLLFSKHPKITYPALDPTLYKKGEVVKVYAIGFGACLISRHVFGIMDMPWFKTNWPYVIPETQEVKVVGGPGMGADFFFSMACHKNNIDLHLDCGTVVHHKDMDEGSRSQGHEFPMAETLQVAERGEKVYRG